MREDIVGVVQFIHPGKEQTKVRKDGRCYWSAATRSDGAWPHRRKFMINNGSFVDRDGKSNSGVIGFWGEWEGPSVAQKLPGRKRENEPTFAHSIAYYEPESYETLLDTDPFVFGERFLYNGCQQHTNHYHPEGARDTFLRRMGVGSMILFGSPIGERFVLDTCFVVGDYCDYARGEYEVLEGLVPHEYYAIALHPQALGNPTVDSFRLYRGATYHEPVNGMFSFTPCREATGLGVRFERPRLDLGVYTTQNLKQGKKLSPMDSVDEVAELWNGVRDVVLGNGLMLGHSIELRPVQIRVTKPAKVAKPRVNDTPVVEEVTSKEIGTYFAVRAPGKAKAYTQSLPECKNVDLLPTDRVADIGSFIGEYAMRAARAGVASVRAFEPTPFSYSILERNLAQYDNAEAIHAAVVPDIGVDHIDLYLSSGNGTRNRIDRVSGRDSIRVPAVSFANAMSDATVAKIDTEGAEWTYPIEEQIHDQLRAMIIEFHPREPEHEQRTREIIGYIESKGFRRVYPDTDERFWDRFTKHGKTWGAHGAWVRKT